MVEYDTSSFSDEQKKQLDDLYNKIYKENNPEPEKYNSRVDTLKHQRCVRLLMEKLAQELVDRGQVHDESKMLPPEVELFDEYSPKLKDCTYGSDEYKRYLEGLSVALEHHYAENSHHPEHYENGVNGMNLMDIVELICDWTASSKRHNDGDIYKSIAINQDRFKMSEQLCDILRNTVDTYFKDILDKDYEDIIS